VDTSGDADVAARAGAPYVFVEQFGIGMNPAARVCGMLLEDEKWRTRPTSLSAATPPSAAT